MGFGTWVAARILSFMTTFHRGQRTFIRLWAIATLLTIGWVLNFSPAFGHSVLLETNPEDGAQLPTAPAEVSLTFNEDITDLGTEVVVETGDGHPVNDGDVVIEGPVVTQPLQQDLPEGSYTVIWRAVSADGHPISGELTFTAAEATTSAEGNDNPQETPTEEDEPAQQEETTQEDPSSDQGQDTPDASEESGSDFSLGTWVVVGVVIAAVAIIIGVIARN